MPINKPQNEESDDYLSFVPVHKSDQSFKKHKLIWKFFILNYFSHIREDRLIQTSNQFIYINNTGLAISCNKAIQATDQHAFNFQMLFSYPSIETLVCSSNKENTIVYHACIGETNHNQNFKKKKKRVINYMYSSKTLKVLLPQIRHNPKG